MENSQFIKEHEAIINLFENGVTEKKYFVGFDGFVDEILQVVDKRIDAYNFSRVKTIKEYGERILSAIGLSANIEFVTEQVKIGGNGPIYSNALLSYDQKLTYAGALGKPVNPVFAPLTSKAKVFSFADPGRSDALEFDDGKIINGKLETIKEVNYENLISSMGEQTLIDEINQSDLLCFANWTMLPYMTDIWKKIQENIMPKIKGGNYLFFDLADPEKRTKEDIKTCLETINAFTKKFKTILGLNLREARQIAAVLGIDSEGNLEELATGIDKNMDVYGVVIHPVDCACASFSGVYSHVTGLLCKEPKLTTGAGDNFNAGFCFGITQGLNVSESLAMGTVTSGFYVRNAKSPTSNDIVPFLKNI